MPKLFFKKSLMTFALASLVGSGLVITPIQAPTAAEAVTAPSEDATQLFTITPVIVTNAANPDPAAHWNAQNVESYVNTASNFWTQESAGKFKAVSGALEYHNSNLNLNTESGTLTNSLVQEHKKTQRNSLRYQVFVYFLPQATVTGTGNLKVAASSWGNNHRTNGLFSTGGAVVIGTKEPEATRGRLVAHEVGHNFEILHANSFHCATAIDPTFRILHGTVEQAGCQVKEYTDYLDIMGSPYSSGSINSAIADNRGLVQSEEVLEVIANDTPTDYVLNPWGNRTSNTQKAIKVKNANNQPLYLEYRTNSGTDLNSAVGQKSGVRFLKYNVSNRSSVVLPTNGRTGENQTWPIGSEFVSYDKTYKVIVKSQDETQAVVTIVNLTQAEKDAYVVNSVRYDDKITITGDSSHIYQDSSTGRNVNIQVLDHSQRPVKNEKISLTDAAGVNYGEKTTNSNGEAAWRMPSNLRTGEHNLTVTPTNTQIPPSNKTYTVEKREFAMTLTPDMNDNIVFRVGSLTSVSGNLEIKADGKSIFNGSVSNNLTRILDASEVADKKITWTYAGDSNTNSASGSLDFYPPKTITPSLSLTNDGAAISTSAFNGQINVSINNVFYKNYTMSSNKVVVIPDAAYKNGDVIKVEFAGSDKFKAFSKSLSASRIDTNWTHGAASDNGYATKLNTPNENIKGFVKYYVNDELVKSNEITNNYNYTLPASFYKSKDSIKFEYTGDGLYKSISKTTIATKTPPIVKTNITSSGAIANNGYTVTIPGKTGLTGSATITIDNKDYKLVNLSESTTTALIPPADYKNGSEIKVSYAGNSLYNPYNMAYTAQKLTTAFSATASNSNVVFKHTNSTHAIAGDVKIYINNTLKATTKASKTMTYTLASSEYENGDSIKFVYTGDGLFNSITTVATATKPIVKTNITSSGSIGNDGYTVTIPGKVGLTGSATITVNDKAYKTLALSETTSKALITPDSYSTGAKIKVAYAGNSLYNAYNVTYTAQKLNTSFNVVVNTNDVTFNHLSDHVITGDVKIYVNNILKDTVKASKNMAYTLTSNNYKDGDTMKLTYSGDGFYNEFTTTKAANKPIVKTNISATGDLASNGYTVTIPGKTGLTGTASISVDGRLFKQITLKTDVTTVTIPHTSYKNDSKIEVLYSGNALYNSYSKTYVAKKGTPTFTATASTSNVTFKNTTANALTGDVKVYVNNVLKATVKASKSMSYTLTSGNYAHGNAIKFVYSGDGLHNTVTKTATANKPAPINPSIKRGDIVVKDSAGKLWNYYNIVSKSQSRKQIGSGFQSMRDIVILDFNADGTLDIIANNKSNGRLYLYTGKKTGGFNSSSTIGTAGWSTATLRPGKLTKTSKYPSLIVKFSNGDILTYTTSNGRSLKSGKKIISGAKSFTHMNVGYVDGDTKLDVLLQTKSGSQMLYRTNGSSVVSERRANISSGWGSFKPTSTAGQNSGRTGLVSISRGKLYYHQLDGNKKLSGKKTIGTAGWSSYYILPSSS